MLTDTLLYPLMGMKRSLLGRWDERQRLRFRLSTFAFSFLLGFFDVWYWKGDARDRILFLEFWIFSPPTITQCGKTTGVWDGVDCVCGFNLPTASCTTALGVAVLAACRAFRSVISCPIGTAVDAEANGCATSTWWHTTVSIHVWEI